MGSEKLLKLIKHLDSKMAQLQIDLVETQQKIETVVIDVLTHHNIKPQSLESASPKWSDIVTKAVDEKFD